MFYDLGLTKKYRHTDQRFEIDGVDEARRILLSPSTDADAARGVWTGIALHTTPEAPLHMAPEIALVTRGVEITAAHPRPDFTRQILAAFTDGIKNRPDTTFGNVKADVLAHVVPGFRRGDFVEVIQNSDWPD